MRRVVITGIGVVAPNGAQTEVFWDNCLKGIVSVAQIPEAWKSYYSSSSTIWAPLPPIDFFKYRLNRLEMMQSDMTAMLASAAAYQALSMAKVEALLTNEKKNSYTLQNIDASRIGVYIGTGIGGISSFAASEGNHVLSAVQKLLSQENNGMIGSGRNDSELSKVIRFPPRYNPFSVTMSMPNTAAATLGIKYSIHGPNITVCNACAAGTTAIGRAFMAIRSGEADTALAGGVEYLYDDYGGIFRAFDTAKTLVKAGDDPLKANRPFDKARTGFLFAEGGAALLVIESLDNAIARGVQPIAEISSFAETFDAYSMMSPDPSGHHTECMLRTAISNSDISTRDIDYINTHGTGTVVNDQIEANTIERIFGDKPLVNSTKSLIGHTIGASGAIEVAVTALSVQSQTTHICKNLEDPIVPLRFVREAKTYPIQKAITQSFAFGGHNAALVLSRLN
jgi:3-oxoacyl-[acyl-carrier-protein] synthase II